MIWNVYVAILMRTPVHTLDIFPVGATAVIIGTFRQCRRLGGGRHLCRVPLFFLVYWSFCFSQVDTVMNPRNLYKVRSWDIFY